MSRELSSNGDAAAPEVATRNDEQFKERLTGPLMTKTLQRPAVAPDAHLEYGVAREFLALATVVGLMFVAWLYTTLVDYAHRRNN
jgi:hypothetical protein